MKKTYTLAALAIALTGAGSAHAQSNINANVDTTVNVKAQPVMQGTMNGGADTRTNMGMKSGFAGTVTAISGNMITLAVPGHANSSASSTLTIDASNAMVDEDNASSSVSDIEVGDRIMVEGSANGKVITATKVHNGAMAKGDADTDMHGDDHGDGMGDEGQDDDMNMHTNVGFFARIGGWFRHLFGF